MNAYYISRELTKIYFSKNTIWRRHGHDHIPTEENARVDKDRADHKCKYENLRERGIRYADNRYY